VQDKEERKQECGDRKAEDCRTIDIDARDRRQEKEVQDTGGLETRGHEKGRQESGGQETGQPETRGHKIGRQKTVRQ
jgi:hypothetical protein